MTNLEIILTAIIYIIVGLWICWKRNWYKDRFNYTGLNDGSICIVFALLFMPINLLIIFIDEFLLRKWDNY